MNRVNDDALAFFYGKHLESLGVEKKPKKKLRRQVHKWAPKLSMRSTNCSNALQ